MTEIQKKEIIEILKQLISTREETQHGNRNWNRR